MKADGVCSTCMAPVRNAVRQVDGKEIVLNPSADVDGPIGIVAWEPERELRSRLGLRTPIVSHVTPAARTETPLRYTIHSCTS